MREQSNRVNLAEHVVFVGLVSTLMVAPLPFGADRPWAWSLLAVVVGGLVLIWGAVAAASRTHQTASLRPIFPALALFTLVLIWAAVQSWGGAPAEWHNGLWRLAGEALGAGVISSISVDAEQSRTGLMRLLTYGGVFLLAFQLCGTASRAERLVRWVLGATLIYATYGIIVELAGIDRVLWYPKRSGSDLGVLSSTFLSRNNYATYGGLGLICAVTLLFRPAMRKGDMEVGWRFATQAIFEYLFARTWIMMLAAAVLFASILMTNSRAGVAVAVLGVSAYLGFIALTRKRRRFVLAGGAAIIVVASAIFGIGGGATLDRLSILPDAASERYAVYERTIEGIRDTPLVGTGAGSFAEIFPMYRSESLATPFTRAHNTYLENALELGIPATALLLLALAWIIMICFAALRHYGRRAHIPCMGLAITALVATHSLVDYTMTVPAIAVTYAALLGVACSQALRLARPDPITEERRNF
jgi:O-antigen ligase